jgi:hypothetical protein
MQQAHPAWNSPLDALFVGGELRGLKRMLGFLH